jgi:hypothetical protein
MVILYTKNWSDIRECPLNKYQINNKRACIHLALCSIQEKYSNQGRSYPKMKCTQIQSADDINEVRFLSFCRESK